MSVEFKQTGDISIQRCRDEIPSESVKILLLGAIGSGKSSFIEALAGKGHQLGISGGTLESVTQNVEAFKVVNMHVEWDATIQSSLYIVDTPGFSDTKISELEIVNKLEEWRKQNGYISYVFYFCRITDTRLPGSGRRLMKIIRSLDVLPRCMTVVTTMWDTICREEALKRAETRFGYLQDAIWKDRIDLGTGIVKFNNTQSSAVEVLMGVSYSWLVALSLHNDSPLAPLILAELLERIQNAQREREAMIDDRIRLLNSPDHDLDCILIASLRDVHERLDNYIQQLVVFGPLPSTLDVDLPSVIYQALLDITLGARKFVRATECAVYYLRSVSSRQASRRDELEETQKIAVEDYIHACVKLRLFGTPPPNFSPFVPTVKLNAMDKIKLEALFNAKRLQLRLKRR
ncbi:hypothetical protein CVT24_007317 [Panaeolus cyanescens]|uniref:G domain-containing protein n=1 Tax=Panaeolus cyanescens TaxID=181874 RepID=A0A409YPK8_9AGAR|nr:hypothetical protein CVT24_007317 [Panaeolus cyanescens]